VLVVRMIVDSRQIFGMSLRLMIHIAMFLW